MIPVVATEHFSLNPAERQDVEKYLAKLDAILAEEATVRLFLSRTKDHLYRALCKVHFDGEDIVAEHTAYDLHSAVSHACESLRHQTVERKSRNVHLRRKNARMEIVE